MRVSVRSTIGDLADDRRDKSRAFPKRLAETVRHNAHEGNRLARGFASEQHTMFGDEDIEYPPSFTVERKGRFEYEYGPDAAIGDGSQASGYEFGSINSPPHFDLARSVDVIGPEYVNDIEDLLRWMFQ